MCFFAVLHVLASLLPLLSPPHPLLSAQSHQSSTSMHFSSGHNGDHMLKRALKPNTGHLQIKAAVSSRAELRLRGRKAYLRPHQHAVRRKPADNTARAVTWLAGFWRCLEPQASGFGFHCEVFRTNVCSRARRAKNTGIATHRILEIPRTDEEKVTWRERERERDRSGLFTMSADDCPLCIGFIGARHPEVVADVIIFDTPAVSVTLSTPPIYRGGYATFTIMYRVSTRCIKNGSTIKPRHPKAACLLLEFCDV